MCVILFDLYIYIRVFATLLTHRYKMILKVFFLFRLFGPVSLMKSEAREKRHAEVEKLLRKMEEVTMSDTKNTRALQPAPWQPVLCLLTTFSCLVWAKSERHVRPFWHRCRGQTLSHTTTFWWTVPGHPMQSWLTFRSEKLWRKENRTIQWLGINDLYINLSRVEQIPCIGFNVRWSNRPTYRSVDEEGQAPGKDF